MSKMQDPMNHVLAVAVGKRIESWRRRRGLSPEALSRLIGVTYKKVPYILHLEAGVSPPRLLTLFQIAKYLNVSVSQLLPEVYEVLP